ncbi:hypothetical protein [Saccharopolyspora griseoalba]|uniref:Uncharacterized protein n=1 Tax=Saccharopolyspora griseoalba TaxID=1431848 RepID=A0ABW2LQV5_9PSEU
MTVRRDAHTPRHRGVLVVLLGLLLGVLAPVAGPAEAGAAPADGVRTQPKWMDCYPEPSIDMPNQGLVGLIDPGSEYRGQRDSLYQRYSYAGTLWHTYGYAGPCAVSNPDVGTNTWIASSLFNVAKNITAITNAVHYSSSYGTSLFTDVDEFVQFMSGVLYNSVYTPYVALAVLLASVLMLVATIRGDLATIGKRTSWLLVGMTVASLTYMMPMVYIATADNWVLYEADQVEDNILLQVNPHSVPSDTLPTLLYHETVYRPWLAGEFGSSDPNSPLARRYADRLLAAQACDKTEAARGCDVGAKKQDWEKLAEEINNSNAGSVFSGEVNRAGYALQAVLKAVAYGLFPLVAKLGLLLSMLVLRVLILAGPLLGGLAIVANGVLPKVFRALGGAVWHAFFFTLAAALHVVTLTWITAPERDSSEWKQILIMLLVTIIAWVSVRPFDRMRQMASAAVGARVPGPHELLLARQMRYERRRRWARRARMLGRILPSGARSAGAGGQWDQHGWWRRPPEYFNDPDGPSTARASAERIRPEITALSRPALTAGAGGPRAGGGDPPPPALPQPAVPPGPRPLGGGGAAAARPEPHGQRPTNGGPGGGTGPTPPPTPGPTGPVPPLFRPDGPTAATPATRAPRPARAGANGVYEIWDPTRPPAPPRQPPHPSPGPARATGPAGGPGPGVSRQSPQWRHAPNPSRPTPGPGYDTAPTRTWRRPENRPDSPGRTR